MKQGYNSRLDESLGSRNGKKSQGFKARRHESEGMEKKVYGHKYGANAHMDYRKNFKSHCEAVYKGGVKKNLSHNFRK
jgi:hypothetical protein